MREFSLDLRKTFLKLMPDYLGTAEGRMGDKIEFKSNDGTPVGDLDRFAMRKLRECISIHFPNDLTVGEEDKLGAGDMERILADSEHRWWTVDGLDGTGNRQMETTFGGMVSLRQGDAILYSAIFRPMDQKIFGNGFFTAERGCGAWRWYGKKRRRQLWTVKHDPEKRLVVIMEGSSRKFFHSPRTVRLGQTVTTRSSVSSCFATTIVAGGQASSLLVHGNPPWDEWPSLLFITEAGGIVSDWDGNPVTPTNCSNIIASGNEIDHAYFVELLNP